MCDHGVVSNKGFRRVVYAFPYLYRMYIRAQEINQFAVETVSAFEVYFRLEFVCVLNLYAGSPEHFLDTKLTGIGDVLQFQKLQHISFRGREDAYTDGGRIF